MIESDLQWTSSDAICPGKDFMDVRDGKRKFFLSINVLISFVFPKREGGNFSFPFDSGIFGSQYVRY